MASQAFYVGAWTNWSELSSIRDQQVSNKVLGKGYVMSATLTLPSQYGSVLIAFLALFVSWTGSQLWNIICYGVHQFRSNPGERDGIHHQIQAILRTGLADLAMLWRLMQMSWFWRKRTTNIWTRTSPLMLSCAMHFAIIAIAGLFSSRIADSSDQVLIKPNGTCGWPDARFLFNRTSMETDDDINSLDSLTLSIRTAESAAKQYSRTCYPRLDGFVPNLSSGACSSTVVPFLNSTVNTSAACPFVSHACDAPAISFDSGWIDSHTHLGINAPPKDRVQVRRVTTCAPVPLERDYSGPWFETPLIPSLAVKPYYVGDIVGPTLINATSVITNLTLLFSSPYWPK
jgi:hypothetical protein